MARKTNSRNPGKRPTKGRKPVKRKVEKRRGLRFNSEYHNIIVIFLGMFFAYGLYSNSGAVLPKVIQMVFKGLFGGLAILLPIVMIVIGVLGFVDGNEKIDRFRKTKMFYVAIVFLIIYYGLINYAQIPSDSMLSADVLQDTIKMGVTREGIGLIPSFITYYLTHILGLVGAWLLTIFATIISVLYIFKISMQDIMTMLKNPKSGKESIFSKIKFFKKKNANAEDVDDATIVSKTGFFDMFKSKLGKNESQSEDEEDDGDKTIKIVGFNKAEDDYLEILEGTQGLSDLEILQKLQNEEPDLGVLPEEDEEFNKTDPAETLFDDHEFSTHEIVSEDDLAKTMPNSNLSGISDLKKKSQMSSSGLISDVSEAMSSDENEHLKYMNYKKPPVSLLNRVVNKNDKRSKQKVLENARQLEQTLKDFGVDASINQVTVGPTITRYEIQPRPGVKVSKIVNLTDDIALSLAAKSIRMEAPIPGKSAIGIEVPNDEPQMVSAREIIESPEFNNFKSPLAMGLGKDVSGKIIIGDISKMPHLLIAGSTGSGKSVCVNTLITSILYKAKPDEVKLMLIDPKVVELANYNGIPHLMIPVVTDPKKAANALCWAVTEMNRRYKLFAEAQVKDISSYNDKTDNPLPKIVIIIDELADLMMASANEVEDYICRLAQMARAAGMHLIVATQRPSVDVITGVIKANIPSRIAFAVSSQTDSRTIIDMGGAEKLLGKGDMLFYPLGASKPRRLQGAFISEEESDKVIEYVKKEAGDTGGANYIEEIEESISNIGSIKSDDTDEFLYDAIEFVVNNGQASASMLQRKFKIGFNRAARLIDDMEERGIVGPSEGSKPRKVLISKEQLSQLQ
ncbi:FtsK/SpoIIIE family DNA translocase [Peptostreptococcus russellii]|uniref:DNA segregation ATPase FtsK/SpoIIIE, S-DNA-T family n=1 Tax=Peptostreptococcus russellii TaxID=215200 RepID=A0A1H8EEQ5_9FIRM|nr:DNA translocase FtsK [Peptostreptococcus russellii]SEN17995.1 DNA segregation ATPase FtsK/SpoIIIE, S-DNA-T family [Peptostreptococcus russellii]